MVGKCFTMFKKITVMKNNDRKKGHGVRRDTNRSKNRPDNEKIINKTLQKSIIKIEKISIFKGGEGSRGIYLIAPESG